MNHYVNETLSEQRARYYRQSRQFRNRLLLAALACLAAYVALRCVG